MMGKPFSVLHRNIDGAIEDRETGHLGVQVELHPLGTELDREKQVRELHIRIGGSKTVLDEEGIAELKEFLEMKP